MKILDTDCVQESKLRLLAAKQASNWEVSCQDKERSCIRKAGKQEEGGLMPQRTFLPESEFRLLLHWKGTG